jgi:hypothetical protein
MLARQRRPRERDPRHLRFVAERPCVICRTNVGVCAHHIKMANPRICKPAASNIGMKADDCYTLPLCFTHHEQLHAKGEAKFWRPYGSDDVCLLALSLYQHSVKNDPEGADSLITIASYALQAMRYEP